MMQGQVLSDELLDILVCPMDHKELIYVASENVLYNERLRKYFEVKESIPVMLVDKATDVDEESHNRFLKNQTRKTGLEKY